VSTKVYKKQEPLLTSITLDGVEPEMHTIVECGNHRSNINNNRMVFGSL
jgi:hypothetical protein